MRETILDLTVALCVAGLVAFGLQSLLTVEAFVAEFAVTALFGVGVGLWGWLALATEAACRALDNAPHFDFARATGASGKAQNTLMAGVRLVVLWLFMLAAAYYAASVWPRSTLLFVSGFTAIVVIRLVIDMLVLRAIRGANSAAEWRSNQREE